MPKGPNLDPTCEPFQRVCVSNLLDVCESGIVEARGARLDGDTHLLCASGVRARHGLAPTGRFAAARLVGDTHLWDTRIGGFDSRRPR